MTTANTNDASNGGKEVLHKGEQRFIDLRLMRDLPATVSPVEEVRILAQRLAPGFYLDVGNVCNQHCLYCAVPKDAAYRTTAGQAREIVHRAHEHGHENAILIGGEPTIWPHLDETLDEIGATGVKRVILTTNGMELAETAYLDHLMAHRVDTVGLSLDDFDRAVQAVLCSREDNPQLLDRVVDNLRDAPIHTYFYTVVTGFMRKRGAEFGRHAVAAAHGFAKPPAFILAGLKPVAEALSRLEQLAITLTDTATEIRAAMKVAADRVCFCYRDVPLCLMPDLLGHSMDLYHANATLDLTRGLVRESSMPGDRAFVKQCNNCTMKKWCPGIYRAYLDRFGTAEFVAMS